MPISSFFNKWKEQLEKKNKKGGDAQPTKCEKNKKGNHLLDKDDFREMQYWCDFLPGHVECACVCYPGSAC